MFKYIDNLVDIIIDTDSVFKAIIIMAGAASSVGILIILLGAK